MRNTGHAPFATSDLAHEHDLDALRDRFAAHGQSHVFRFVDRLGTADLAALCAQCARIDLGALERVHASTRALYEPDARRLEPWPVRRLPERGGPASDLEAARARGESLLRDGRVGVIVVAGGQGTRLGFAGPKGAFPIGPVSGRSLFALHAQKLRGLGRRFGRVPALYVMTSPSTDAATRALFAREAHFGLDPADVFFLQQREVPSLDFEGRLMLDAPHHVVESPGGHGGVVEALVDSGAHADLARRGVDTLFYFQVDNPLVRIADPTFVGLHHADTAEMSCKVIAKRDPLDRLGHIARVDGHLGVVEYTEIPARARDARDAEGNLVFWAGSPAIHVFDVAFLRRCAEHVDRLLPWHASAKKIPHLDTDGRLVRPSEPNGWKLERFVFDALPAARRVLVLETRREDEYEPVKNAHGRESPESARRALVSLYRRWLSEADVEPPPPGAWIEIDHARFDGPDDLRAARVQRPPDAGDAIVIATGAHA